MSAIIDHTPIDHTPIGSPPAAQVVVETILLSVRAGQLRYRVVSRELSDGGHPDAVARSLAGLDSRREDPSRLLHSTSWRFHVGSVVLTYAALPDPDPAAAIALDLSAPMAYAVDPLAPALDRLTTEEVAGHACRHLAYLRHADPMVRATAAAYPELWEPIARLEPTVAGLLAQPGPLSAVIA